MHGSSSIVHPPFMIFSGKTGSFPEKSLKMCHLSGETAHFTDERAVMSRLSVIQPGFPEEMFPEIVLYVKSPVSPKKLLILCLVQKRVGFSGEVDFRETDVREKA